MYWTDEPQGPAEAAEGLGRKRKAHQPSIFDSQVIAKIGAKKRKAECDSIAKTPRGRGGK